MNGSDWLHQESAVGTTRWLQRDQTLSLSLQRVWLVRLHIIRMIYSRLVLQANVSHAVRVCPVRLCERPACKTSSRLLPFLLSARSNET